MSNLPTSFCIDIVAEKEHERLQEFKDWINEGKKESDLNYCHFTNKYYGLTKNKERAGLHMGFGKLLTLNEFFTLLDPKPYTILDLSNGVCAVENDGTELEIERVLQSAFPKDDWSVSHSDIYFYAYKPLDGEWEGSSVTSLPTQSVKLFLAELEKPEPITSINEVVSVAELDTPTHYDNSLGSLYKIQQDRGWNAYQFDIIKRIDRCEKKGEFSSDLKKTKDLIDLYNIEQGHKFKK